MSLLDHLEELRHVLLRATIALAAGSLLVGLGLFHFSGLLQRPLQKALEGNEHLLQALNTSSPFGVFSVILYLCLFGGIALALPYILYISARFIAPGLTPREKAILRPACVAMLLLFLLGAAFSYCLVLPASLSFAIELNKRMGFQLIWSATEYYGMVAWLTLGIGLCFEFPLVLVILQYLELLSPERLRRSRRLAFVLLMMAAALITPGGDPFTLFLLTFPLYLLYEGAILVGAALLRKKHARQESEEDLL